MAGCLMTLSSLSVMAADQNYIVDFSSEVENDFTSEELKAISEEVNEDNPYINIVAVQEGHENDDKIKALVEVLKSDEIKEFVDKEYKGAVVMVD